MWEQSFIEFLFYCLYLSFFLQLFYAYSFLKLSFYKKSAKNHIEGVSVIICAKDESSNLSRNLESFLEQDFPLYEVIVVDDQSIDGSRYILKDFSKRYSHLNVVTIEENVNHRIGKKFALTIGIKTAKYDQLLLTDADCKPSSDQWIKTMSSNFDDKEIVLGYSPYKKQNGFLNILIRFDAFQTALQYFSASLHLIPYMGVGRNLAYKKSLFFKVKGFASHIHISSGDDDLFIKDIANRRNTSIEIDHKSHVISDPKTSWEDWVFQKRRHLSPSFMYKIHHKILLSLWPFSLFVFWISSIFLFILSYNLLILYIIVLSRFILFYLVYYKSMRSLRSFDLYLIYPFMEIIYVVLQLFFVLLNFLNTSNKWK